MKIIETANVESGVNIGTFKKSEPVLWHCQGMFCIIPMQIIQNAVDVRNMYEKFSIKTTHPMVHIFWDQGIPVDPKVGYALLGE